MQNPPKQLFTGDLAWDKQATHTDDLDSFFPIHHLQALAAEGRIGHLSSQFHCVPTEYSKRRTLVVDAPEIFRRCREDKVDVALLVPLWPVCHQTVSLVARILEEGGISTVILGSGRDIVEYCGVPRFQFTDYPLGNPCGKPWDQSMQRKIVELGLTLLEEACEARSTRQTPYVWSDDSSWKDNYMKVDAANLEQLKQLGEQRQAAQQQAKQRDFARTE